MIMTVKKIIILLKAIPRALRRSAVRRNRDVREKLYTFSMSHALLAMSLTWDYRHHGIRDFQSLSLSAIFATTAIACWVILIKEFVVDLKSATAHQIEWS